jgi:hypothetical protein
MQNRRLPTAERSLLPGIHQNGRGLSKPITSIHARVTGEVQYHARHRASPISII